MRDASQKHRGKGLGWRRPAIVGGALVAMAGLFAASPIGASGASDFGVYRQTNLVSDIDGVARITDPNLVNPWGMSELPGSPIWVSDNNANVSSLYRGDQKGAPLLAAPLVVTIPDGSPTGQVANTTTDFVVSSGGHSAPALFIFASENGGIDGWAPTVGAGPSGPPSTTAISAVPNSNSVYKGLAIDTSTANHRLYAANFRTGSVDVFNSSFQMVNKPGAFVDPNRPPKYAPFNIFNANGTLYVSYALQNDAKHDDVKGPMHGYIDTYSLDGVLLNRLVSGGKLNSPWGMVIATNHFGAFSNDLLVGNFGDGRINAYNPTTGAFLGTMTNRDGNPIAVNGLWGLIFGDKSAGTPNTLYFAAGIADEAHGLLGSLTPGDE
jgi:uncharacterized protein (TIGR03118 family)